MLSRVRVLWRAARETVVFGALLAAADRVWWARTIRRADIVDLDFVAAQAGRRISARAAVRRYVRGGFRTGFTLNPLFMERPVSRQLSDSDRVPALYAYLVNDRRVLQVSPNWDAPALAALEPDSLADPAGPLGHAWRRARERGWVELGRASIPVRVPWADLLRTATTPPPLAASPDAGSRRLFVCVLGPEEADPDRALSLARDAAHDLSAEVDLVLTGDSFDQTAQAAILALHNPHVTVRRGPLHLVATPPHDPRAGQTVFRGPDAELTAAGLHALAEAGSQRPAAALWLTPAGVIASAGTVFLHGAAVPLLDGLPMEDAQRLGDGIEVPALAGPARAWPAGSSPTDPGRTMTAITVTAPPSSVPTDADSAGATDSDTDTLLARAGLAITRRGSGEPEYRRVSLPSSGGRIARRWAIKTSAPAGAAGESWGETHFARGIADALRRLGQDVVIDAYDARDRATNSLDDVTLVLRGPQRIDPPLHGRRILWIISHPDEITRDEVHAFDAVFAASTPWAARAASRFARPIEPLLQCTDTRRFHPEGTPRSDEIVFVGTARGIARPVVVTPVRAGVPIRVYGPDWRGYIPAAAIAATGIPNAKLPRLYEGAGVVLNDHWPAMKREGFVSNRLYDVVAAGGRAISDDVDGIDQIFGGAVQTFQSPEDLVSMLEGDIEGLFPPAPELARLSAVVRERDSFDARARALINAADATAERVPSKAPEHGA
ncbi:hypothetical protein ACI3KY_10545 [Microbacterium sp. ZW T2_14]|uniref:glycosyltransferase family protein n=1 Tax=Microbacterium sp. ZW T2_14 TaxID=3378079 RepID=UPI0038520C5D